MTPPPLDEYIYERNKLEYNDKWGPTYDYLSREKGKSPMEIIESSYRPNKDITTLLPSFEIWLRSQ